MVPGPDTPTAAAADQWPVPVASGALRAVRQPHRATPGDNAGGYRQSPGRTAPERFDRAPHPADDLAARRSAPDRPGAEFRGRRGNHPDPVRGSTPEPPPAGAPAATPGDRGLTYLQVLDMAGTTRLVAYVVPAGTAPSTSDTRGTAGALLPGAVVPGAVLFTDRLPRTRTGEIARGAQRALGTGPAEPATHQPAMHQPAMHPPATARPIASRPGTATLAVPAEPGAEPAEPAGEPEPAEVPAVPAGEPLPAEVLADAVLDTALAPAPRSVRYRDHVLLTGATGFVGAHLLSELLARTEARVVCPVRAGNPGQALDRIRQALARHGVARSAAAFGERVLAVPADLTKPSLGIPVGILARVLPVCAAIYHTAAAVDPARGYRSLRPVNVQATREVLRLAAVAGTPVHYVSTLAVAPPLPHRPEVAEDFVPPHGGLRIGYQQGKWVSERLVQQAGERGLPVAVYRLGRVTGPAGAGHVREDDLFWRILLAGIRVGAAPDIELRDVLTPADWVASALLRLSLPRPAAPVVNLAPVPPTSLAQLAGWAAEYGYPLRPEPLPRWLSRVRASSRDDDRATAAFVELAGPDGAGLEVNLGPVRRERLDRGLAGSGLVCPPVDALDVHRCLDRCVERGLLPAPPRTGVAGALLDLADGRPRAT